jgi:NADH-quinone oxidoreductase subunit J
MNLAFYVAAAIAVLSTVMMLTRVRAVHALLYLVVSFLSISVVLFSLGAPFVAALEVIVYAGAIMVLFVFVVMLLNLGERAAEMERRWLTPGIWIGPAILAGILLAEVLYLMLSSAGPTIGTSEVGPVEVGAALFGPYVLGVELASLLLLTALIGANHLGWPSARRSEARDAVDTHESRTDARGNTVHVGADRSAGAAEHPVHTDVP